MFTIGMVKPDAADRLGAILTVLTRGGLIIEEVRELLLIRAEAREFYAEHEGKPWLEEHLRFIAPSIALSKFGRSVVFLVLTVPSGSSAGREAVPLLRSLLGPTDPVLARERAPESIRALFGSVLPRNAVHGSADEAAARRELRLLRRFLEARGE